MTARCKIKKSKMGFGNNLNFWSKILYGQIYLPRLLVLGAPRAWYGPS